MLLSPGEVFGTYEILAPLGAGGMGEVYRARDVKLEREVAIKVLPSAVAQDPQRLARFEREAKVLASLNHTNIAQIYGVEERGNTRALAMELVAGATLSSLQSLETALNYAWQISEALEAAHDKGITHRDLKPANIMITPDGVVKLLDFGLAAVPGKDSASSDPAADAINSPTLTMAATQAGVILGTAAYMSPEQASGKVVDRRSDIWSFGVVFYEMLAGVRLFAGETVSHTLADVLRAEIPFDRLPPSTPAPIRELVERCLDRDIRMRLQSISEARIAIQKYLKNPSKPTAPAMEARRWLWPSISVVLAALLLAVGLMYYHKPAEQSAQVRLSFTPPPGASFNDVRSDEIVVSPDGRSIAFSARDRDGRSLLWVRALDSSEAKPLPGTDDPLWPFWSPDSRSLAFGSRGKLKRVDLVGRATQELCDAPRLTGGTWNSEGTILFGADYTSALYRVSSKGGTPVAASVLDRDNRGGDWNPRFLPDGKHFLFHNGATDKVGVLGSMQAKPLLNGLTDAQFVPPNSLLFVGGGRLLAQRFDPDRQELQGEPLTLFSVPDDVRQRDGRWCIVDLVGKHGRVRTAPMPTWVRVAIDAWTSATTIATGHVFRPVNKAGSVTGEHLGEKVVWQMLRQYAAQVGVPGIAPHDLRRTCAKLCRAAGGELEQIQLLLGHASVQTTERYLGTRQDLVHAPNDAIKLRITASRTEFGA